MATVACCQPSSYCVSRPPYLNAWRSASRWCAWRLTSTSAHNTPWSCSPCSARCSRREGEQLLSLCPRWDVYSCLLMVGGTLRSCITCDLYVIHSIATSRPSEGMEPSTLTWGVEVFYWVIIRKSQVVMCICCKVGSPYSLSSLEESVRYARRQGQTS